MSEQKLQPAQSTIALARDILRMIKEQKLTDDPVQLARAIEVTTGLHYLVDACQRAACEDVFEDTHKAIVSALGWGGHEIAKKAKRK